ncbi:MAG: hypothetical protein ABEJ76_00815 [Halanaeroarchaeum sp.]
MNRRDYLAALGTTGATGLAGCAGLLQSRSPYAPPVVEDRPDAVYYPSHVEGMAMIGTATTGRIGCALTYTYPHRFWLVTGTRTERVSIQPEDSIHLMPVVWDRETGIVLPDASPGVDVTAAGEVVASINPWAMLSQPMGMHFGDNVQLPGDGGYTFDVGVASPSLPRLGGMAAAPTGGATCSFDFEYSRAARNDLSLRRFPDRKGTRGAVEPMTMEAMPTSQVPAPDALPGRHLGSGTTGDAKFVATALDDASAYGGTADQSYLAVSPRTPYNRHMLPAMGLTATVTRGAETRYDGPLTAAVAPDLSVHYGAVIGDVRPGDDLVIGVRLPPQVARHEGYETAFLAMGSVSLRVG